MIPEQAKKVLKKQHYEIVGEHSAVQICRWTKKSLCNDGVCYKEKFYGIKSHLCCQMTPSLYCPNQCVHCWRAIEFTTGKEIPGKADSPKKIIEECIQAQRKLLTGFKINKNSNKRQLSRANQEKLKQAQEPMQFAISLSGEPTIYPYIGGLIKELRKRGKTSFLVTNGLYPGKIKELAEKKQLPTQLYVSVNTPNKKLYDKFHRSSMENAWEKLNETLEFFSKLKNKTRTIFRINLIKNLNMVEPENYAKLIKKANPMFIEIKGFMSIGFARGRLGYERMPTHKEIVEFVKKILKFIPKYKILDEQIFSRVCVLGRDKGEMRIKENQR